MSDLVSRQAAIKNAHFPMIDDAGYEVVRVDDILALPSAKPKTGEWIPNHDGSWNCSECGLRVFVYAKGNYCPNCGAKMCKGGDDE